MTSIMDDITVFATLMALVVTSVGFVAYYSEKEEVDADSVPVLVVDDKPLPLKEDVLKAAEIISASKKVDDSDALTAATAESSDDDMAADRVDGTKRGLPSKKSKSKRWSRITETKRDPKKRTNWFWRPSKKEKVGAVTIGCEI